MQGFGSETDNFAQEVKIRCSGVLQLHLHPILDKHRFREKVFTNRTVHYTWMSFPFWPKVCSTVCIRHDQLIRPHPSSIISLSFYQLMRVREIVCLCTRLGLQFGQTKNDDLALDPNDVWSVHRLDNAVWRHWSVLAREYPISHTGAHR